MNGIDPSASRPGGLFDSLRALMATLSAMARTRVELFGTELEEEIDRIIVMLLSATAVLALACMALLFGAMLIVVTFWDTHRIGALAAVAGGFGLLAVVAAVVVRSNVRRRSRLFAATVGELERDRQLLANRAS